MTWDTAPGQSGSVQEQASLTRPGRGIAIVGLFLAGAAVWVYAVPLGVAALACGGYARLRGERLARIVVLVAVVCAVGGFFLQKLPAHFFG